MARLKAGKAGPEVASKLGRSGDNFVGILGSLLGSTPPASGPALWGYTVVGLRVDPSRRIKQGMMPILGSEGTQAAARYIFSPRHCLARLSCISDMAEPFGTLMES